MAPQQPLRLGEPTEHGATDLTIRRTRIVKPREVGHRHDRSFGAAPRLDDDTMPAVRRIIDETRQVVARFRQSNTLHRGTS
jgi:hypothetical protein